MTEKKLYEVEHRYYCNDDNYFSNECNFKYKSWQDFISEMGDADPDLNLIFRWDWKEEDEDGDNNFNGDMHYRNGICSIYYMGQHTGRFNSSHVEVCRADEPEIRKFLSESYEVLKEIWEPLS